MTSQSSASGLAAAPASTHVAPRKGFRRWLKRNSLEIALCAPFALYVAFFMFVPVLQSIYYSFVRQGTNTPTFDNYRDVVGQSQFSDAFWNTIGITVMGVTMEMVIGLIIALMLTRAFRGRGLFRSIVLIPMGVPTLVAGAAMLYFVGFNGYLNKLLLDLGIIDVPVYWQQSGLRGMFVIALSDLWKTIPLVVLILLAGLEAIPGDVYEAADVDGANDWQKFWNHTIPLLMPAITMALILRAIDAFRIFDIAMVIAGQAIPVMSSFVYFDYQTGRTNTASAAAVILLLMIVVFVIAYIFLVERRSEVER
ncbi:MAG: sugar ABC transporter permease [Thermomicrobiales bacterium]